MRDFVKGPFILRGKKIGESNDDYYFEIEMSSTQKMQFVTELLVEHSVNGTLIMSKDDNLQKAEFIKNIITEFPDMSIESKELLLKKIASLL